MATRVPLSQGALNEFLISQLVDNGMDTVAKKINRLYGKLHACSNATALTPRPDEEALGVGTVEPTTLTTTDDPPGAAAGDGPSAGALRRKYARQLQHWLAVACRLLARHRDQASECLALLDLDLKQGTLPAKPQDGAGSSTTEPFAGVAPVDPADEGVLAPGRHVAAKVARSHELWILARVVSFDERTRHYEVEDVDGEEEEEEGERGGEEGTSAGEEEEGKTAGEEEKGRRVVPQRRHHVVPREQVKGLPADTLAPGAWHHYALNQRVMAMYPNTTSFYRGVVRVPSPEGAPFVLVRFDDDADEFGSLAPDRKIPLRFVIAV